MNGAKESTWPSPITGWYIVFILMLCNMMSFVDRQILSLLFEPIKNDLGLSYTELSLLHGFAFTILYAVIGFPLARYADRGSRKWLITAGMTFWTLMTAACGLAQQYWHLLLIRIGVGVGEASLSPAAHSLMADLFPKEKSSLPMGAYSAGTSLGMGLAIIVGGFMIGFVERWGTIILPMAGELKPWQTVFMLSAAINIPVLLLLFLTIREPNRRQISGKNAQFKEVPVQIPVKEAFVFLAENLKLYGGLIAGYSLTAVGAYSMAAWLPTLFHRQFGLALSDAGMIMGSAIAIGGLTGSFAGGAIADWLDKRGVRSAQLQVVRGGAAIMILPSFLAPLMPNVWLSSFMLGVIFFAGSCAAGPVHAAIQAMTPVRLRAQAVALHLFFVNLIGLGLGPTLVAAITDYVFVDENALGNSLSLVAGIGNMTAIALMTMAIVPYGKMIKRNAQL